MGKSKTHWAPHCPCSTGANKCDFIKNKSCHHCGVLQLHHWHLSSHPNEQHIIPFTSPICYNTSDIYVTSQPPTLPKVCMISLLVMKPHPGQCTVSIVTRHPLPIQLIHRCFNNLHNISNKANHWTPAPATFYEYVTNMCEYTANIWPKCQSQTGRPPFATLKDLTMPRFWARGPWRFGGPSKAKLHNRNALNRLCLPVDLRNVSSCKIALDVL